ncbi:MAG: SufD family Fe-S cluster assembly protein, partial [Pseudomonadota bacterium]|nr:SufD family Fe-S cluster assembly protein [Pseudomonadota bacterium]
MTDFQQTALQLAGQQQSPEWLAGLREQGASTWAQASWPTRKTENWKYLSLAPLQQYQQLDWGVAADGQALDDVEQLQLDATRLVFINGRFSSEHSSSLPAGIVRFGEADGEQRALISQHLGRVVDSERHLFAALSNAWAADGVLVHVPRGQRLEKPLYVLNISTPQRTPVAASQRLLLVLEDNAEAELIEHYASDIHAQNGFVNSLTEVVVGNNAQVQHYRINLEQEDLLHVGGVHVNLQRDARFHGFTLAQGSRLKRIDYQVNMLGEGAHLDLNGIYLPR